MRRILLPLCVMVLGLGACDQATGPSKPRAGSLVIVPNPVSLLEGDSVRVQVLVYSTEQEEMPEARPTWTSTDPSVARINEQGYVLGLKAGQAKLIAQFATVSDTLPVEVRARVVMGECTPVRGLAVGEVRDFSAAQSTRLCLEGAAGAEYLVMPTNTASSGQMSVEASGSGLGVLSQASMSRLSSLSLSALSGPRPHPTFEQNLRMRERRQLGHLVDDARLWKSMRAGASRSVSSSPAAVGDLLTYNTQSDEACTNPVLRTGRVVAVGSRAVVVADTTNPADGLTQAEYEAVASRIDHLVWPVLTETFGEPADLDQNSKIVVFYTRAVNEMTPAGQDWYVGGFFYSRDLFPKTATPQFQACAGSNQAEMFYMLAADPTGQVNGNKRSKDLVIRSTVSTIGHELQHLINASRRLYVHSASGSSWNETVWLNEGLSHIAEELLFYRESGLAPRANIDLATVRSTQQRLDALNGFMIQNLGRFKSYLESPESQSPFQSDDDLATRGAIWSFLRYAADRRGGNDRQLWYDLLNSPETGRENLNARLAGVNLDEWMNDWKVAHYADDFVSTESRFTHPSWNFRTLYPAINNGAFPLRTRPLLSQGTPVTLAGGGAAYFRAAASAAGTAELQFLSGGAVAPEALQVRVLRSR